MRYGRLDRRITIEVKSAAALDEWSSTPYSWVTQLQCWGQKTDESSVEGTDLQQLVNTTRTVWRIRYDRDITTQMRVKWIEGKEPKTRTYYYNITGIKEIGRRAALDLITELSK
tara:strand:- start:324 stop:665 length:342 start_codon:yes stop_codon:yes gene_type:complete